MFKWLQCLRRGKFCDFSNVLHNETNSHSSNIYQSCGFQRNSCLKFHLHIKIGYWKSRDSITESTTLGMGTMLQVIRMCTRWLYHFRNGNHGDEEICFASIEVRMIF